MTLSCYRQSLKAELFRLIKACNPQPQYLTDVVAGEAGHEVLRLPVGHCELNSIELVWAKVKGFAAR